MEKQSFDYKRPGEAENFGDASNLVEGLREPQTTDHPHQVKAMLAEYERKLRARRWKRRIAAVGLGLFGVAVTVPSCILSAFATVGAYTTGLGILMLVAAGLLIGLDPKGEDVNRAIMAALRGGGVLTVIRLALELDISTEKAEKIIGELVRKGVAEIDLAASGPDGSIVYRIKGL